MKKRRKNPAPLYIISAFTRKDSLRIAKCVEKYGYSVFIEHDPSYANDPWHLYHDPVPGYTGARWSNARQIAREYVQQKNITASVMYHF